MREQVLIFKQSSPLSGMTFPWQTLFFSEINLIFVVTDAHSTYWYFLLSFFFYLGGGCGSDNQQNAWTCTIYTRRWRGALILCLLSSVPTLDIGQIKSYEKDVFASKLLVVNS